MRRVLVLSAAALFASGCAVDQNQEVSAYRSDLDVTPPTVQGDDLPLRSAAALVVAHNERLGIQGERYLQALIDRRRNVASLLPTLDLFGTYTFRDRSASTGSGSTTAGTRLFDGGLRMQYTALTGLTDVNRIRAAELTGEQQRWLTLDLRETLLIDTVRAYYAVLLAERRIEVIRSSLGVQDERLRDIRGRSTVGFARPLDVAQIEAQAAQTRAQLVSAQNDLSNARSALALLTGVDVIPLRLRDDLSPPHDVPDVAQLDAMAVVHRQDLAAARAQAASVRTEVDAEIGRYYPTVSINFDYFLTRESVPTDRDWTGLLSLNLPIFSAGRIDADVRDAWSRFRQAVLNHSLVRREIRRDAEVAHADLVSSRERLRELDAQVRAARESLRQAEASYAVGLGTNLERITAQDQVLSAELLLAEETFASKIAYLAASRAVGQLTPALLDPPAGGWPEPPPQRPVPESPFVNLPASSAYPNP